MIPAALDITQVEEVFALLAPRLFYIALNAHLLLFAQYVRLATKDLFATYVLQLIMNLIMPLLLAVLASALFLNAISALIVLLVLNV